MYILLGTLSIIQILLLSYTYWASEQSHDASVRDTVSFVLLVHLGASMALALMSMRKRALVTPNMIGLSLYTLAGSLSLGLISQTHEDPDAEHLAKCSVGLLVCGILSFGTCWWTVYKSDSRNVSM
ncbi:unnamed protein product [Caenorhabditis sp. 36 PRJEB53466]|nr:unnamed protein product [Caenorhabditis sp. 36 PRJEB53466]